MHQFGGLWVRLAETESACGQPINAFILTWLVNRACGQQANTFSSVLLHRCITRSFGTKADRAFERGCCAWRVCNVLIPDREKLVG